jgi:hypothetical protein
MDRRYPSQFIHNDPQRTIPPGSGLSSQCISDRDPVTFPNEPEQNHFG